MYEPKSCMTDTTSESLKCMVVRDLLAYLFTYLDLSYCGNLKIWFILLRAGPGEDHHYIWLAGMVHQGPDRADGTPHRRKGR